MTTPRGPFWSSTTMTGWPPWSRSTCEEGFRTAVAVSGAAALTQLTAQPVDLILVNLKLPDMTGEQFVRTLEARNQVIPFVVLAEHGDEPRAAELLARSARLPDEGRGTPGIAATGGPAGGRAARSQQAAPGGGDRLRTPPPVFRAHSASGRRRHLHLDVGGRITFVNHAARRMLGYEQHELSGADLAALAERPASDANGHVRDALAANTTFRSHDQVFWRKDGSCFPIE